MFLEVKASLIESVRGMIRRVKYQFHILRGCPSRAEVRRVLKELPENLDKTYERILRSVPQNYCYHTLKVLQWLCITTHTVRLIL